MKFKLDIDMGNAAFADDAVYEVARILKSLDSELSRGYTAIGPSDGGILRDINGNNVGKWEVIEGE